MKRGFVILRLTVISGLLVAALVSPDNDSEVVSEIPVRTEIGQTLPPDSSTTCYTAHRETIVCPQRTGS